MRAPDQFPPLSMMLDDVPYPNAKIARHLGISHRTLQRYVAIEDAPRAVLLALFWETQWGRSCADAEAANFGHWQYQLCMSQERQIVRLRDQLLRLERELESRLPIAANAPIFQLG